jgi:hypothetical protein
MWIRRYDSNVDGAVDFTDFVNALTMLSNYQRTPLLKAENSQQSYKTSKTISSMTSLNKKNDE